MPVKDIMTSRVIAVTPETYINDVIHIIEKDKISGIPVVDEENKLVGIISEKDILRKLFPNYSEFMNNILGTMHYDFADVKKDEIRFLKAKDIMQKKVITIPPDSHIMEACAIMVVKQIRRLPIVDEQTKKLLGIVSQSDVFHALLKKATLIINNGQSE